MTKLSISIPDELANDLREVAPENVSAFVATAVRHELDRRRLFGFLDELENELGPADEDEVSSYNEKFSEIAAASAASAKTSRAAT